MQYADDTILFIPQDNIFMINYKRWLECYDLMTGLEINFSKSALVSWNTNQEWIQSMSLIMERRTQKLPMKYLGVPIGKKATKSSFWEPVLDKIEKRLAI